MLILSVDEVNPGMLLGEDLTQGGTVIITKGTVLSANHLSRIKKFNLNTIVIDDTKEREETISKASPKAVSSLSKKVFRKGEFICIQGEKSEELFILVQGELDVIYTDEALFSDRMEAIDKVPIIQEQGKKISVIKGKMVNFGELGALLKNNRTATICAREDSIVASIPATGESFKNTILKNARLGLNISITIAKRLKDINVYIAKYNGILSQVDNMVREFSTIYVALAGKILKKAIQTRDQSLQAIHEQIKKSALYNRLLKYQKQSIDSASYIQDSSADDPGDTLFNHGNLVSKKAGEMICYNGEAGDKMYVLVVGKLGVFVGDKMVAVYERKGDIIGEISVLLGYASKNKGFDKRTATVKAITRTKLMCIEAGELDSLADSNPGMIFHITISLAERLRISNRVFIDAQNGVDEYMNKLAVSEGSCGYEIEKVLGLFTENINSIEHCMNEVKVLKKMHESIEQKYDVLKEKLGSISLG